MPPHRLERIFRAHSVAIVGASENSVRARNAITAMSHGGVDLHLVNRRGDKVLGQDTARSLTDLVTNGTEVDAAIVFTNAAAAIDITAEAAALGIGGVIINAAGFAEAGHDGALLQQRLVQAAGQMPVIGPNCNGVVSPIRGLHLAGSPTGLPIPAGTVAFVTHSGATMMPMGIAGAERMVGYSYLVSTGNEAAVDMAQVIDYLATDPDTTAICLLIETIRDPAAFWAAVDQAIAAGKPILALKNGRSARGQAIAKSHTGAVAGDAWIYESALRQHGVIVARDLVDLADRTVLFGQVPRSKWCAVSGLAIVSGSGGWVTMASDVCAEEDLSLPTLEHLAEPIRQAVPEATVINPLDLTGRAMTDPAVMSSALNTFVDSTDVDAVFIQTAVASGAADALNAFAGPALSVAPTTDKLLVVGSIEGGPIGDELRRYLDTGVAVTRGLRATTRALKAMAEFTTYRAPTPRRLTDIPTLPRPRDVIAHPDAGLMLSFTATMELLAAAGIPVAPYVVTDAVGETLPELPFAAPYVVKLADVPHRSDIGAVRAGVTQANLFHTIDDLRDLARRHGESQAVVIQPQVEISSELLLGANCAGELGPVAVCGLGGVLVEVLHKVAGRLAPFSTDDAMNMLDEINVGGILDGPRGRPPWPRDALAASITRVGDLASGAAEWLETLDINPLALTSSGLIAVDGLVIVRPPTDGVADAASAVDGICDRLAAPLEGES